MKVLPFYTSTAHRDAERVNAWNAILCPNHKLLPFQIQRTALSSTGLTSAVLVDCDGGETNILAELDLTTTEKTSYDFITYAGLPLDTYMNGGTHYVKCSDGTNEWFSEWIQIGDIQPSLLSSWGTLTGFTVATGGSRIGVDCAFTFAGDTGSPNSNTFAVKNGEALDLSYNFALSGGSPPAFRIKNAGGTVISNTVNPISGSDFDVEDLTVTDTDSAAYLECVIGNGTWTCGRLSLRRKYGDFIHISFTNTNDIQGPESIFYASGFTQDVYLNAYLNSPGHESIETGEEKNGVFQAEKIVDKLVHSVVSYESRSLFKALRILPMHDTITIYDEVGNSYTPSQGNLRVAMDWTTFDTGTLRIDWNEVGDVWTSNMDNIV